MTTALITVLAGIGVAVLLFWLLNKLAEALPSRWEERLKPFFYILPAYAAITMFLVYPAIQTVIYSFKTRVGFPAESWTGLDNYRDLLGSPAFRDTLFNTLLWIIIVPTATVMVGLAVAVMADRLREKAERAVKTIIFMPMAISLVGAGTVWGLVYDFRPLGTPQVGIQNAIVVALGGDPVPWVQESAFRFNSMLLMVMLLWAQAGFAMVLLSAAVKGVPVDTLEAARIDGANEAQIFTKVIVPQIWSTIVTVFVTVLIAVMKIFDIVYVMTNGNFNTNVVANEFYAQFFTNNNQGAASAIVVMLMIAIIPVMAYQVRNFRREEANR
ncbi:carbohydrate ABC transporter permease [Nocardioides limicola]|uniref:carbohydrate ABC transporter permease n=1 Tax=Nocardioides limicola TaxID=2803368 RepID=UPI0027DCA465|nr:sugar ABC transporter permease [Nocardioides sp. DJM-14]